METLTLDALVILIAAACNFSDPAISKQDKIDCGAALTNCVVVGDGSVVYLKKFKQCVKKKRKA